RVAVEARVDLDEAMEVRVGRERRVGAAVDSDQLRRHALTYLRLVPWLGEEDEPGVRMHVDEARAHDPARRLDHALPGDPGDVPAQDRDALVLHGDRAVEA